MRPETPPAAAQATVSWTTIALAAAALAVSGLVLIWTIRRRRGQATMTAAHREDAPPALERERDEHATPAEQLALLVSVGEAMVDSGYPVAIIRQSLDDIGEAYGIVSTATLVFPTALMISVGRGSTVMTRAVVAGESGLLLHQIDALDDVITSARRRRLTIEGAREQVARIRSAAPPFHAFIRLLAYVVLCAALSVLLGASLGGVGVASVLGLGVGVILQLGSRLPYTYQSLLSIGAAFAVSVAVFLLVRASLDPGVFPSLVAPLVVLLPGGLLTTAVIELSTGQYMSGAARLAGGAMRLLLLALGIVAAAALVGIPSIHLNTEAQPLGPVAPWIAVGLFGVGIAIHQSARPVAIGWIVLVLYVAYSAQVLGDVLFGGVLSAFVGALVMTPVAALIARLPSGPATIVSSLPAFWLLVPGALGLVGVTSLLDGDSTGINSLVTTTATMAAIALGVLVGLALIRRL